MSANAPQETKDAKSWGCWAVLMVIVLTLASCGACQGVGQFLAVKVADVFEHTGTAATDSDKSQEIQEASSSVEWIARIVFAIFALMLFLSVAATVIPLVFGVSFIALILGLFFGDDEPKEAS
jgi:hypothetical protein